MATGQDTFEVTAAHLRDTSHCTYRTHTDARGSAHRAQWELS